MLIFIREVNFRQFPSQSTTKLFAWSHSLLKIWKIGTEISIKLTLKFNKHCESFVDKNMSQENKH